VRGFNASSRRSISRLSASRPFAAPTAASAISVQRDQDSPDGHAEDARQDQRSENNVCSKRTNEAYVRRRPGVEIEVAAVVIGDPGRDGAPAVHPQAPRLGGAPRRVE